MKIWRPSDRFWKSDEYLFGQVENGEKTYGANFTDHCKMHQRTGANSTVVSYNASDVNNYNATSSPVRFEMKNDSSSLKKML
jgi:hypothetical protein